MNQFQDIDGIFAAGLTKYGSDALARIRRTEDSVSRNAGPSDRGL